MRTAPVHSFLPDTAPADPARPQLVWAAPGSLFVDDVESAWTRSGRLADLADVQGPWAVLLWDPARAEHLVVSDPVGVQPVYWARTDAGEIAVSSSLPAIAEHPGVDDSMSVDGALIQVLHLHGEQASEYTALAGVTRVPWGSAVAIGADGRHRNVRYWDPRWGPGPDESLTLADSAELLRERIDAAIRRLLPSEDVGIGGHVSSGIDCSTITSRVNQILRESGRPGVIAGYSWSPDESLVPRLPSDERDLIDAVTAQEGFAIRRCPDDDSAQWLDHLDPVRYPMNTVSMERYSLTQARSDGVQVMFSGWGGDELASFNGRMTLEALAMRGRFWQLWQESTARVELRSNDGAVRSTARAARMATMYLTTGIKTRYPRLESWSRDDRDEDQRKQRVAAELRAYSPRVADMYLQRYAEIEAARDGHQYQLALFAQGHMQRRTESWFQVGGAMGISYRYPLLDLGVVQAALRLPWWAYRTQGWNRVAYRKAVAQWIPGEIAWNVPKAEPSMIAEQRRRWMSENVAASAEYAELARMANRIHSHSMDRRHDPSRRGLGIRQDRIPRA